MYLKLQFALIPRNNRDTRSVVSWEGPRSRLNVFGEGNISKSYRDSIPGLAVFGVVGTDSSVPGPLYLTSITILS